MTAGDALVGVWSGCPYPTMEVELVFCPCGRGLLFFYWGSAGNTPFVDEFSWTRIGEERIKLEWVVRHDVGPCIEWMCDDDEEDGTDADIYLWIDEETGYTLLEEDGSLGLDINIGMHCSYNRLYFSRPPQDYEQEKRRLQETAEHFSPFGPGRQMWLIGDDGEYQKLPVEIVEDEEDDRDPVKQTLADEPLNVTTLLLIFGIFGQIGFISEWVKQAISPKIAVPLFILPILLGLFREDPVEKKRLGSVVYWVRTIAALWYFLLAGVVVVGIMLGGQPRGWWLYAMLITAGLWPAVQVFVKRRKL